MNEHTFFRKKYFLVRGQIFLRYFRNRSAFCDGHRTSRIFCHWDFYTAITSFDVSLNAGLFKRSIGFYDLNIKKGLRKILLLKNAKNLRKFTIWAFTNFLIKKSVYSANAYCSLFTHGKPNLLTQIWT